jgi:Ca2+-binding RTX toxin-like protein
MPVATKPTARLAVETLEDRSTPALLDGIGVVGDSYTSERGGNNWPEQLAPGRSLNFGPSHEAVRDGVSYLDYDYITFDTPETMLTDGTITTLASQVAAGTVTLVYLDGMGNDFARRYPAIYNGTLSGQALSDFIDAEVGYVRQAMTILSAAGPVKFVLENVGDIGVLPFIVQNIGNFLQLQPGEQPDPLKKQRFTNAIQAANAKIVGLADELGAPMVDQFAFMNWASSRYNQSPFEPYVSSPTSNVLPYSTVQVTDPTRLYVDAQHIGPTAQGLKANIVLTAIQRAYGVAVPLLTGREILTYAFARAGLGAPQPQLGGVSIQNYAQYTYNPFAETVVTAAGAGTSGVQLSISAAVNNPLAADQAVGFSYQVDWGDGTTDTTTPTPGNGSGVSFGHTYQTAGVYHPTVKAANRYGLFGLGAPTRDVVAGSPGADTIALMGITPTELERDNGQAGRATVTLNGQPAGIATSQSGLFLVLGGAGDDTITFDNWEIALFRYSYTLSFNSPGFTLALDGQDGSDSYIIDNTLDRTNWQQLLVWNGFDGEQGLSISVADSGTSAATDWLTINGTSGEERFYKNSNLFSSEFSNAYANGGDSSLVFYSGIEERELKLGGGNDTLYDPGVGDTTILGGPGDDTIIVADTSGVVTVDGGDGSDTIIVQFGNITGPVTVRDTGTTGSDTLQVLPADGGPALTATSSSVSQGTQTVTVAGPPGRIPISTPAGTPPPQVTNGAILYRTAAGALDLLVGGTAGNDHIVVTPEAGGAVQVLINGVHVGTFRPTGRIVVSSGAGDDDVTVAGGVQLDAWLYGGDGGDRLKGGGGHNVLLGGDGDDLLVGGNDRDLLIGGKGADRLVGNAADDVLIAGWTLFDDEDALGALLGVWVDTTRTYQQRVAAVGTTGVGANQAVKLNASTVSDDGALDVLTGTSGQDWFFANLAGGGVKDKITDLSAAEFVVDLDFING